MIEARAGSLRVVALEQSHVEVPLLTLAVRGGLLHGSPDKHQLAHLHEHLAFQGHTGRIAANADLAEQRGAIFNAHTLNEWTQFEARAPRPVLADAARHLAHMAFAQIEWRQDQLEVERRVITAEHRQRQSTLRHHVTYLLKKSTVGSAAGAISPKEHLRSLERISLDDILAFRSAYMTTDNAVLLLLTNNPEADLNVVTQAVGEMGLPRGGAQPWVRPNPGGRREVEYMSVNARQSAAGLGFRSMPFGHHRQGAFALALGLLAFGTGARLYRDAILTHGIAYSIDTHMDYGAQYGFGSFMAVTSSREHGDLFLKLTKHHIDEIADAGPGPDEWARAKERYFVHLALVRERPDTARTWHTRSLLYVGEPFPFARLQQDLSHLDPADIQPLWREVFSPEQISLAVVEGTA